MAHEQIRVSINWRDISLHQEAVLSDVDGSGGFLQTDKPMPVGTMLVLSPLLNRELRVPARVALVVEACRSAQGQDQIAEVPGMNLTFEAVGEALLGYLEEPRAAKSTAPQEESPEEYVEMTASLPVSSTAAAFETPLSGTFGTILGLGTVADVVRGVAAAETKEVAARGPSASEAAAEVHPIDDLGLDRDIDAAITRMTGGTEVAGVLEVKETPIPDPDGPDKVIYEIEPIPGLSASSNETSSNEIEEEAEENGEDDSKKKSRSRGRKRKKKK
jgi:hypothetical protein